LHTKNEKQLSLNESIGKPPLGVKKNTTLSIDAAAPALKRTPGFQNKYMAVTTQTHCSGNNLVQQNRFRVQVQTKDGKPGPDWIHGIFSVKGGGKEWWEYDPPDQKISKHIMDIVKEARKSMQT